MTFLAALLVAASLHLQPSPARFDASFDHAASNDLFHFLSQISGRPVEPDLCASRLPGTTLQLKQASAEQIFDAVAKDLRVVYADDGKAITVHCEPVTAADLNAHDIRIVPVSKDNLCRGLRVFGIKSGSGWARLDFENGDIVVEVEGNPVCKNGKPDLAVSAMLADGVHGPVAIERHGKPSMLAK